MPRTQLTPRPSPALGRLNKPLGRELAAAQRPAKLAAAPAREDLGAGGLGGLPDRRRRPGP